MCEKLNNSGFHFIMMSNFDSDSQDSNQPKRVQIFKGDFCPNEDYTYVRGRGSGSGKYVCEECSKRFDKSWLLKRHIRTHTNLRPHSCRHCAIGFKTRCALIAHMKSKTHHKKCVELGITPVPITIHDLQMSYSALAKQQVIEQSYPSEHFATDFDENKLKNEVFPVPINTSSYNESSLEILKGGDEISVSQKCYKTFNDSSKLNFRDFEKPFRCDPCNISFMTEGHLQKHERSEVHSDRIKILSTLEAATKEPQKLFKCNDCLVTYEFHNYLTRHFKDKNHIMKLESLGKLPCGMYSDMERFKINSLMDEVEIFDYDDHLILLQKLALKMYSKNGEVNLAWLRQSSLGIHSNFTVSGNNLNHDSDIVTCSSTSTINTSSDANCENDLDWLQQSSSLSSTLSSSVSPPHYSTFSATSAIQSESTTSLTTDISFIICHFCEKEFRSATSLLIHLCEHLTYDSDHISYFESF